MISREEIAQVLGGYTACSNCGIMTKMEEIVVWSTMHQLIINRNYPKSHPWREYSPEELKKYFGLIRRTPRFLLCMSCSPSVHRDVAVLLSQAQKCLYD